MSKRLAALILALSAVALSTAYAASSNPAFAEELPDWAKKAFTPHGGNGK